MPKNKERLPALRCDEGLAIRKSFMPALPNCDCGASLPTTRSGRVCTRYNCVRCTKCTPVINGARVCVGCITQDEHEHRKTRVAMALLHPNSAKAFLG